MNNLVYLGLGSNLGDRQRNLQEAVNRLALCMTVKRVSSAYETEPWGYRDQPRFLNAACSGSTALSPRQLLHAAKTIETAMHRVPSFPNAPRPIDIDILLYGDQVIWTPDLVIPHPELAHRPFVLVPLVEIAPDLVHPRLGTTIKDLLQQRGGMQGVHWHSALRLPKERA